MNKRAARQGFTLVEVMVVVVIVAVLLAIALPAYQEFSKRSRRGDAVASLLQLSLAQEKWRANHTSFGALADVWSGMASREGHYLMAVIENTGETFVITASPRAGGPQAGDDCGTYAMNQEGPLHGATYAGPDCWQR